MNWNEPQTATMANKPQQEIDVIIGVLNKVWPYNADKPTAPAKLVLDTDDGGSAEIAFFNQWDDFENKVAADPPRFGSVWDKVDPDRDKGRRVQIIAIPAGEYSGRLQYKSVKSLKFLDGAPTPAAAPTEAPTPAAPAPQATGYAPASRQEQGLALGNSKTVASAIVAAFVAASKGKLPDAEWLKTAAAAVNTFSTELLSGVSLDSPADEVEEVAEVDDDDSDLGEV
jgi:hypothetical protein